MLRIASSLMLLLLALTACGEDDAEPAATHTASDGSVYNDHDITFTSEMIQHHAEALALTDLTREYDLSPKVSKLADQIAAAQTPEIQTMTEWLTDWGEPIPETVRDHANAGHGGDSEDILESADDIDTAWLEAMIEHHEGAVTMAEKHADRGVFEPAVSLAESVATSQADEIAAMEDMIE